MGGGSSGHGGLVIKSLIFTLVLLGGLLAFAGPQAITVGVIPGGDPEQLREQGTLFAQKLQEKLQIPITLYISKDYKGLIEAMKTKKIDFAFFSSRTFVEAEQEAKAKVLLKKVWNYPYYYSTIIVPKNSKIKKLADLKGKKIAFVDENSASGYLYPKVALQKEGLKKEIFAEVAFSGNHQASIQFLETGKVDAAAVFMDDEKGLDSAWTKFATQKKPFRILWKSSPIPNDPFTVRQDFYDKFPKETHSLMFAMIEILEEKPDKNTYSEVLGLQSLMPATSKQYDPVREMVKELNLHSK